MPDPYNGAWPGSPETVAEAERIAAAGGTVRGTARHRRTGTSEPAPSRPRSRPLEQVVHDPAGDLEEPPARATRTREPAEELELGPEELASEAFEAQAVAMLTLAATDDEAVTDATRERFLRTAEVFARLATSAALRELRGRAGADDDDGPPTAWRLNRGTGAWERMAIEG